MAVVSSGLEISFRVALLESAQVSELYINPYKWNSFDSPKQAGIDD